MPADFAIFSPGSFLARHLPCKLRLLIEMRQYAVSERRRLEKLADSQLRSQLGDMIQKPRGGLQLYLKDVLDLVRTQSEQLHLLSDYAESLKTLVETSLERELDSATEETTFETAEAYLTPSCTDSSPKLHYHTNNDESSLRSSVFSIPLNLPGEVLDTARRIKLALGLPVKPVLPTGTPRKKSHCHHYPGSRRKPSSEECRGQLGPMKLAEFLRRLDNAKSPSEIDDLMSSQSANDSSTIFGVPSLKSELGVSKEQSVSVTTISTITDLISTII